MPQSDAQTSAITVRDLRRVLRVVLPHLSTDPTLPLLGDVEVTFAEHALTLAATDRFTLAAARAELVESAPAIQWANTVPGAHLTALARMLPRTKAGAAIHVAITATDDHLVIKVPDPHLSALGGEPQWTIPVANRGFVQWRSLWTRPWPPTESPRPWGSASTPRC